MVEHAGQGLITQPAAQWTDTSMKTADADILIVPGWSDSGADHWQSRWERNLRTARRVVQDDWRTPRRDAWVAKVRAAIAASTRPVVLVGHSLGVATIVHAGLAMPRGLVAGAFLVGPADTDTWTTWPEPEPGQPWPDTIAEFAPMPMQPLSFPTRVIASSTDPFCTVERAQALAAAWAGDVSVIADAGHLNSDSGHGPWPEGLLTFGLFMKSLG